MKILFSINPEHVNNILSGKKQVEYRKIKCRQKVDTVLIYSTAPIQRVVAQAHLKNVLIDKPEHIWERTKDRAGITRKFYRTYFSRSKYAVAYELENVEIFSEPKLIQEFGIHYAPQSFAYVN